MSDTSHVITISKAKEAFKVVSQFWVDDYVAPILHSLLAARWNPASSWSPTRQAFDARLWQYGDAETLVRDSLTARTQGLWLTTHEEPFTLVGPYGWDMPFLLDYWLTRFRLGQSKRRKRGIWKPGAGGPPNKLMLRVPHK